MTEMQITPVTTDNFSNWVEKNDRLRVLNENIRPANKAVLFEALARAGVTAVVVHFDGYGDSGQIEDFEVKAGDAVAELPSDTVEIARAEWGNPEIIRSTVSIRDAIERLIYDFLEDTHAGWENNEGAYGDFTFDVAERRITLDYNERFESSEYFQHEF